MKFSRSESGQAVLFVILLLFVGLIAFMGIYGMRAPQNLELANTVGNNIANELDVSGSTVTDIGAGYYDAQDAQVVWTTVHAARHGATVQDIYTKCNESTGNVARQMRHPKTGRDAFVCFVEGFWVVTIKQFDPAKVAEHGDDVVTSFPGNTNDKQWVIDYLIRGGYQ